MLAELHVWVALRVRREELERQRAVALQGARPEVVGRAPRKGGVAVGTGREGVRVAAGVVGKGAAGAVPEGQPGEGTGGKAGANRVNKRPSAAAGTFGFTQGGSGGCVTGEGEEEKACEGEAAAVTWTAARHCRRAQVGFSLLL